jgi:hypothetical protein
MRECVVGVLKLNELLLNTVTESKATQSKRRAAINSAGIQNPGKRIRRLYTEDMKKFLLTTGQWFLSKDIPVIHENV